MTSLLWRHGYTEHSQSVHYFAHSFTTCWVLNNTTSLRVLGNEHVTQWNLFKCRTSMFHFSEYHPIYLNTYTIYKHVSECLLLRTMLAAVQATDEQLIMIAPLYKMWISAHPANFLHQTCIAGHVKHVTIQWMHLRVNGIWAKFFCLQKTFIVYQWPHSDVIVIKLTAGTGTYKTYILDFAHFEK